VAITVTEAGFQPRDIKVKRGEPVTLSFTRVTDRTCIKAVDIPDEGVKGLELPLGKPVTVTITPRKVGVERFHCTSMGMGNGRITVQE
jgi:plastocyanin domain-containing protein